MIRLDISIFVMTAYPVLHMSIVIRSKHSSRFVFTKTATFRGLQDYPMCVLLCLPEQGFSRQALE